MSAAASQQSGPGTTLLPNLECSLYGLVETATIPSLLDRLVAICGDVRRGILEKPDYEEHEVAFVSSAPPNAEGVKPDETMIRLSSLVYDEKTKERVLDVDAREWKISTYTNTDPRNHTTSVRAVSTAPIRNRPFDFLSGLGFGIAFEYLRKGYYFIWDDSVRVTVSQVYRIPQRLDLTSAVPMSPQYWIVEATGNLVTLAGQPQMEMRLKTLQSYASSIVDLRVPDPKSLVQRLPA